MSETTSYAFAGAPLVASQLRCIAAAYDAVSTERLRRIGPGAGWRCLEIGAGNGSIARWLADLTGPGGNVDATDIDVAHLGPLDRPSLTFRRHDITADPLPVGEYDLIHARLVLMHLPQREDVLARLWSALKPGGWLLTEDYDVGRPPPLLAAPDPAAKALYEQVINGLSLVVAGAGADLGWGSRAYAAFLAAGYVDVSAETYARAIPAGSPGYELTATYVRQLREPILRTGTVTGRDLDRYLQLAEDPRFVQSTAPLVSTWGRRP